MIKTQNFKLLERTSLWKKVEEMKEVPLMLVAAPAGYGKSSVVREYMQQNIDNYIWISLGQEKVQEEWLWSRINHELRPVNEKLSRQLAEMGIPSEDSREDAIFLKNIRKELEGTDFYMVLDDYQTCNGPAINRLLTKLAYEDIPGIHMIVISRVYVDVPFEEMMLKGFCSVINQADLTLTKEETDQLFAINGVQLDEVQSRQVYEYTDGWIAAASLLWFDYQKNGGLQPTGTISRLLHEAVYSKLSKEDRAFLYDMSYFAELSQQELEVVTDQTVSDKRMDSLMEQTGLIHFNLKNQKYGMHSLLRTVAQQQPAGDKLACYRKYAVYREKCGDNISAMEYYGKAGDRESILRILEGESRFELMERVPDFMLEFFKTTPDSEEFYRHPTAVLSFIHCMIMSADMRISQEGVRFYRYISRLYKEADREGEEYADLQGELMVIDSLVQFNDIAASCRSLCEAWELRKHKPSFIFAKRIYSYGVPETLLMYHRQPGRLLETVLEEKKYSQNYMRLIYNLQGSLEFLIDAEYDLETGQVERAYKAAATALQKAKFRNHVCAIISSYLVMLRCLIGMGERKQFEEMMEQFGSYMENVSGFLLCCDYDQACGYVYALIGRLEKVPMWIRNRQLENCNQIVRDSRSGCIIYGIYLCRKKQWVQLSANAEEMAVSFANTRHVFAEIYAGIFNGIALWNMQKEEEAKEYLKSALRMSECDSIVMPFMELSFVLMPLLKAVEKEEAYAGKLIPMCERWLSGIEAFQEVACISVTLTKREQELMELLVTGLRNSDIGRRMNIAQVTVEKNLTNIYRKIGAGNRIGAIKWYTEIYGNNT